MRALALLAVPQILALGCRGNSIREGSASDAAPSALPVEAPAPTLRFADGHLVLDPARASVDVSAPWVPWTNVDRQLDQQQLPGTALAFRHPKGAMLTAVATHRSPGTGSEPTLRDILEDKKKKYGAVDDVAWADDRVAGFPVRTLAFTVTVASHDMRFKMWMLGNKAYWVNFICMAPATDFPAREPDCRAVVDTFHVLPKDAVP